MEDDGVDRIERGTYSWDESCSRHYEYAGATAHAGGGEAASASVGSASWSNTDQDADFESRDSNAVCEARNGEYYSCDGGIKERGTWTADGGSATYADAAVFGESAAVRYMDCAHESSGEYLYGDRYTYDGDGEWGWSHKYVETERGSGRCATSAEALDQHVIVSDCQYLEEGTWITEYDSEGTDVWETTSERRADCFLGVRGAGEIQGTGTPADGATWSSNTGRRGVTESGCLNYRCASHSSTSILLGAHLAAGGASIGTAEELPLP